MKVITIKEPWASLIINGYKKYEFRTWKTNYRGKILIHAGLSFEKNCKDKFENFNLDYSKGEIIGEIEIVDCIKVTEDLDKKIYNENKIVYVDKHVNQYAWVLRNPKKFDKKISCKGKLGLWNLDII